MICNKCNKEFKDGAKFCTHCGAPVADGEVKAPTVVNVTPKMKTVKKAETEKAEETVAPKITEEKPTEVPAEAKQEEASENPLDKKEEKMPEKTVDVKKEEKTTEVVEKKPSKKAKKAEEASHKKEKKQEKAVAVPKKTEKKMTENEPKEAVKEKKEKAPKSRDRVNFFLLLLTLLCPPYFGVLITICESAKAPKATQVYGIFTILSFIFAKIRNYILTVIATFCVVMAAIAVLLSGAYLVLTELGYDITFITDFVSSFLNL